MCWVKILLSEQKVNFYFIQRELFCSWKNFYGKLFSSGEGDMTYSQPRIKGINIFKIKGKCAKSN